MDMYEGEESVVGSQHQLVVGDRGENDSPIFEEEEEGDGEEDEGMEEDDDADDDGIDIENDIMNNGDLQMLLDGKSCAKRIAATGIAETIRFYETFYYSGHFL